MWWSNIAMATGAVAMNSQSRSSFSFTGLNGIGGNLHIALETALYFNGPGYPAPALSLGCLAAQEGCREESKDRYPTGTSALAERDPGFAEIVRGHLHVYFVPDTDADEMFAHFA